MTRLHVNLTVKNLDETVKFYSALFDAEPAVLKDDYAKWSLESPQVNFSVSTRRGVPGVDHIGLEAADEEELGVIRERLTRAGAKILDQSEASCCYARSNKAWTRDPDGVAWEAFHTYEATPDYGEDSVDAATLTGRPA